MSDAPQDRIKARILELQKLSILIHFLQNVEKEKQKMEVDWQLYQDHKLKIISTVESWKLEQK